jgi:hypothetical protein
MYTHRGRGPPVERTCVSCADLPFGPFGSDACVSVGVWDRRGQRGSAAARQRGSAAARQKKYAVSWVRS